MQAIVALVLGMVLTFIGNAIPGLSVLNQYAWLVGVLSGFVFYLVLMKISRASVPNIVETVEENINEEVAQERA